MKQQPCNIPLNHNNLKKESIWGSEKRRSLELSQTMKILSNSHYCHACLQTQNSETINMDTVTNISLLKWFLKAVTKNSE